MRKSLLVCCLLFLCTAIVAADEIMVRPPGPDLANRDMLQAVSPYGGVYLGVSWTQAETWYGVTVSPYLSPGFEGDFWITNSLGPGTTPANVLAYQHATPVEGWNSFFDVTLGPGTYYFVITPTSGQGGWYEGYRYDPIQTAPGVTYEGVLMTWYPGGGLNPASPLESYFLRENSPYWRLAVEITGSRQATIPEPATLLLVMTGAGLLIRRRR